MAGKSPIARRAVHASSAWYTRRRMVVSLTLFLMLLIPLFAQDRLAEGTLQRISQGLALSAFSFHHATVAHLAAQPQVPTASMRLQRIDSADRSQYHTDEQYRDWAGSSCSGIAMAMVMDAYDRHLTAADVLQVEVDLGVWSTQLGLLRNDGIALTASHFGFETDTHERSLDDVIALANRGTPVIANMRDSYYFPGGHFLVVRGGDSQSVFVADSSPANFVHMTRPLFLRMWQGFTAVLTPHG